MLGVALCGGGMKCAAQLGILQVIQEFGIRPALLAGSSMGAVVGAVCATGANLHEAAEQFCRIRMSDVFVGGLPVPGLNHGSRLRRLLRQIFGNRRLEDLPVSLLVTTHDLSSGATHWIDRGDLADALYASCAVPGLFAPLRDGERVLADGCLSDPLPVSELRNRGARQVIGVHFGHEAVRVHRTLPLAIHSVGILMNSLARPARANSDLVIQPAVDAGSGLWWTRARMMRHIETGRTSALQQAEALQRFRAGVAPA